ncbi:prepilin-type N-terminal cleavage/methylation domain-containing protein [Bacillus shivajii]|uniref:prepilin-type N-terminal cleavage/methylation domain-containing protein n=1 Tax=Bacillus shivajii TaxID=1983719 RepID=UPI001CFA1DB5|nr:prepilin-type N-terminal cleavage/methylation domain-containing protein [Bacillus shivajii]UCZ54574.1 prepilin-type N-terminal cleavage/methylation domain-containing protein [Bacillus shivajii]
MKNCNGFMLIEVMIGMFIISVIISVIFPAIYFVQIERVTLKEEKAAEHILQRLTFESLKNTGHLEEKVVYKNNVTYTVIYGQKLTHSELCLQWEGRSGRLYERCSYF